MGMYDRVDYTTDKGKPKGPGLFDVTPEEQAQRDKYAAMNEEAEYADYVARNRVGFENEPVKNPLGFAGGNAAQLAAPYNIDPGLMARQIDNTYATSRKPGRDSRKGRPFARNDAIFGDYGAQADTPTTMQTLEETPQEIDFDFGGGGGGGGGAGGGGIGAAYENYFANQEKFAQEKFDSITDYLDQLQISSDEGFAADMDRISGMYDQRRDARNQRFEEALNRAGGRESAAIDTLAELGIQADANTFDPVTGETRDMLFSQQMSGADMLNSMSYITNTIYDFAKNEQDLAIGAGLENAQQNLLAEMAAIQMARDSKAISDAEAAAAAASAAEEAANLHQYYITMGQSIGMSPEVAIAYGELGMLGDAYGTATEPVDEQFNVDLGFGPMPMTMDQIIAAGGFAPQEGGISFMMGGQPVTLPYNANFQDIMLFAQQQGIPIEPIAIPGQ